MAKRRVTKKRSAPTKRQARTALIEAVRTLCRTITRAEIDYLALRHGAGDTAASLRALYVANNEWQEAQLRGALV